MGCNDCFSMLMPVIELWRPMKLCVQACIALEGCIYINIWTLNKRTQCSLSTSKELSQHIDYRPDEAYNYKGSEVFIVIYTNA